MTYEIRTTSEFDEWLENLKDKTTLIRIASRLDRVEQGNFGDVKRLDSDISEMRFFFGSGYRVYYTVKGMTVVLLINGGDKSNQSRDIDKARLILKEVNEANDE